MCPRPPSTNCPTASTSNAGRELIPRNSITKPPIAELRPNQTDQDSLPPYEVLDAILHRYVEEEKGAGQIIAEGFDPATVMRVIKLIDRSEYKRRQAAPGLKVTSRAFGSAGECRSRRTTFTERRSMASFRRWWNNSLATLWYTFRHDDAGRTISAAYTIEEYLRIADDSEEKLEYVDGEIVSMAGGTPNHSLISENCGREIGVRLKGKPCRVYDSNLRVGIPRTPRYMYPDRLSSAASPSSNRVIAKICR